MTKLLYEILVPTKWNNGKPIRTRHHKEWDKKVRKVSNGLTILHPAKGHWVCPEGILHEERMIPVRVWCTKPQIESIMDMTAEHYKQKAVMAYCVASDVMLKGYTEKTSKRATKLPEAYLREAMQWKSKLSGSADLYIIASATPDTFYLSERRFDGIEVDWTDRMRGLSRDQAVHIIQAGIAEEWANSLSVIKR